jgi:hypothetical protein
VALVIPNPTKDMIKRVETIFYKFVWGKGSEKVKREDCKLPVKSGGIWCFFGQLLSFHGLEDFWKLKHFGQNY